MDKVLARAIKAVPNGAAAANEIWKRLDKLAEDDPAAYKTFIDQQMEEASSNDVGHSSSISQPGAILTAARIHPHIVGSPRTIVIALFACRTCIRPNAERSMRIGYKAHAETLSIDFRVC